MLSNILIAIGFLGTGILVGLTIAAIATMPKSGKKNSKKVYDTIIFYED